MESVSSKWKPRFLTDSENGMSQREMGIGVRYLVLSYLIYPVVWLTVGAPL